MRRPGVITLLGLLLGAGTFGALFASRTAAYREFEQAYGPELAWIKKEFRVNDAEFARVRVLHEAYKPVCAEYCLRIDQKNREVAALLEHSTNVTAEIQKALADAAQLRSECHSEMLMHFFQVSQAMPADEGRRYLAWMQAQTLGSTHQSMLPKFDGHTLDREARGTH